LPRFMPDRASASQSRPKCFISDQTNPITLEKVLGSGL
jgi:hypothetical protein